MVLRSLVLWSIVTRCTGYTSHSGVSLEQPSWARHNSISDFALQRAIQTQLFYMVSTRDGPKASWLARFMNHEHLDSTNGEERAAAMGEGGVGEGGDTFAYRARLGGLRTGHDQYLKELSNAPPEILRIEIAPSRSRMSTMERNNPFLANRKLESFFYDDEIDPRAVASRVALTASALAESWIDELDRQAVLDDERVYADSLENKAVRPYEGEFFKDDIDVDDSMPLFDHDKRALERFTTLQAAATLLDDLRNERDQTANLAANDDDEMVEEFDVNFLVGTRRRKEAAEELQSQGNKLHPKRQLKSQATLSYFESFVDVWCPRLVHGANDHLLAALGKAPPGLPRRQLFRQGFEGEADADEALEHLAMDRMPLKLPGGYLVNPTKLATTLRAYRANVAYDTKTNLVEFKNNIDAFRHTLSSN